VVSSVQGEVATWPSAWWEGRSWVQHVTMLHR